MHEITKIEGELRADAQAISSRYGGVPVVVIVAGEDDTVVEGTQVGSSFERRRLRHILGVLQAAIACETLKHNVMNRNITRLQGAYGAGPVRAPATPADLRPDKDEP